MDAAHLKPTKIIFVDDKADSLIEVELAMKKKGIPFLGFAYSRTAKEHANFDPMIANIQLDRLIATGQILSDEEAAAIKSKMEIKIDAEAYFKQVIKNFFSIQSK